MGWGLGPGIWAPLTDLFSESPLLMRDRKPRIRLAWVGISLSPLLVVAAKAKYLSGRPEGTPEFER